MNIDKAISILKSYKENGTKDIICDIWLDADIKNQADEHDLSDSDVIQIMNLIENSHDANIGINWEVIDCAINDYVNNLKGK